MILDVCAFYSSLEINNEYVVSKLIQGSTSSFDHHNQSGRSTS